MALGKILNLGGIDNRPPKANQSPGRFRVARNVMPTPDGRIIPRYDVEEQDPLLTPANIPAYQALVNYDGDALAFAHNEYYGNQALQFFKGGMSIPSTLSVLVPGSTFPGSSFWPDSVIYSPYTSQSALTTRVRNTVYLLSSTQGMLVKYDGVEMSRCGVTIPRILTTSYAAAGTKFIKIIKHTLDFDGAELWSDALTFPILSATTSLNIQMGTPSGVAVALPQSNPLTGVTPSNVLENRWGTESNFFKGTTVYNNTAGNERFIVTCAGNDISIVTSNQVGSYVFVKTGDFQVSTIISGPTTDRAYGLALKIKKEYTSGTIELDVLNPKYLDSNKEWQTAPSLNTADLFQMNTLASSITTGSRELISVWASTTQAGVYYYYGLYQYMPPGASNTSYTVTIPATPNATNVAAGYDKSIIDIPSFLNTFYDIESSKVSPNSQLMATSTFGTFINRDIFGATFPGYFTCMTTYQGMLLLANDDLIWYSDPTNGGSFEMLEATASITVGNKEDGRIVAICGTGDFLVVSRERKNYYVNGNIVTGNYRIQEIGMANVGAWSNSSIITVQDNVVMLTSSGIYQISDGGRCTELSDKCPKNLNLFDANSVNEDVSFKLSKVSSWASNYLNSQDGMSVAYDAYREFLIFMMRKPGNPCLILHTKTGELYEWDGLISDAEMYSNCATFINGVLYLGGVNTYVDFGTSTPVYDSKVFNENKSNTAPLSYCPQYPIKLYTSWLTGGEPSLEKVLLQLKMFGRVQSEQNTSSINVCHYKDWNINDKVTNSPYFPTETSKSLDDQTQYSHKKRLNSDKVLSASVGFEVDNPGVTFELESIEVELSAIQEGMKR